MGSLIENSFTPDKSIKLINIVCSGETMKSIALVFTKSKDISGQGGAIHRPMVPQPLIYLGSYLHSRGIKVYLIDGQLKDPIEELNKIIKKVNLIGFSVMTSQITPSLEISDYIKEKYPDKKIVWGGIHPSLLPEQTIKASSVDYVCQREGEECLYELITGTPLKKIKNLVYKEKGKIIINPLRKFLDPNKLPSPNWDLINAEDYIFDYKLGGIIRERALPLGIGRGCVFNCTFCVNTVLGRKWRSLSAKNIIKEIKILKKKYNLKHLALCDDCFDVDLKRVDDFCNMLIKEDLDVTWDISARVGPHWTDKRMELIKKAGCLAIAIGAESGSPRVLNEVIGKPSPVEATLLMAKQCNIYKISLISSWISGVPTEKDEELKMTIKLLQEVTKICPSCSIHGPRPFDPYPNSKLYFEAVKLGLEEPKSLREWSEKSSQGFLEEGHAPWIRNHKKLRAIEFYCMNAYRTPRNFFQKVLIAFSRFRIKHNIYIIPFEIGLVNFYFKNIQKNIFGS
jgi:radical SAM superfamily enzyme YgiQ (UPF0313 family)